MIEYELGMERDGKDDITRRVECFSDEDAAKMFTELMLDMTGYGGLKYVLELDNEVLVFDPDEITMITWRKTEPRHGWVGGYIIPRMVTLEGGKK